MNTEEKAKAYDEALERARSLSCSSEYEGYKKIFENIFPELVESEDDKIRKEIINIFHSLADGKIPSPINFADIFAWLEKQGEQKLAWSEEDETGLGDALWCCEQAASIAKDENDMGNAWYAKRWLKSLKDRVQPQSKQEWSEEDERLFEDIEDAISKSNWGEYDKKIHIRFLKSLRPQKHWKPSEEQMEALESATENCAYSEYQDCLRELIKQLKKLREE